MFLIITIIIAIAIVIIYIFKIKKYNKESYYKITNISYFKVINDTGKYGEYLIYKNLKSFEDNGAKFLFNIYVPKNDEETTEIDVLMISSKGVFVFESKNYSGWIFGNDNKKYWYQTLPTGRGKSRKIKFYNPVFQNNTHIKYLKSLIGDQVPVYSIITFSERCTLKNVNVQSSEVYVINRYQVYNLISSIYNSNPENQIDDTQIEKIYNTLYPHTQIDENAKQLHIENIHNKSYSSNTSNNSIIDSKKDDENLINVDINEDNEIDKNIIIDNNDVNNQIDNADTNDDLKDRLIKLRKTKSKEMNIPAYYVFTNDELEKLMEIRPTTLDQLKSSNILTSIKIKTHGDQIIQEIKRDLNSQTETNE